MFVRFLPADRHEAHSHGTVITASPAMHCGGIHIVLWKKNTLAQKHTYATIRSLVRSMICTLQVYRIFRGDTTTMVLQRQYDLSWSKPTAVRSYGAVDRVLRVWRLMYVPAGPISCIALLSWFKRNVVQLRLLPANDCISKAFSISTTVTTDQ